jgi:hypothetical protein
LKLNGTLQLLVYADDVNILGESIHSTKRNAEASIVASKGMSLEANAEKTTFMVTSRNQNAGHNYNIKIVSKSFERVEQLKYLGTILTNRKSVQEEIKSRLKSGNACYHSVQNFLCSNLLSKKILRYTELQFCLLFCRGVKLGLSHNQRKNRNNDRKARFSFLHGITCYYCIILCNLSQQCNNVVFLL